MLKRILSTVILVAVLGLFLGVSGCEDEIETHRQTEVRNQPVHQETVVE